MGAYAVIVAGAGQDRVKEGALITVNRLVGEPGDAVTFETVMCFDGKEYKFGEAAKAVKVSGTILSHSRGKKITVIKFKRRKNYRRKQGHRQDLTNVQITTIK